MPERYFPTCVHCGAFQMQILYFPIACQSLDTEWPAHSAVSRPASQFCNTAIQPILQYGSLSICTKFYCRIQYVHCTFIITTVAWLLVLNFIFWVPYTFYISINFGCLIGYIFTTRQSSYNEGMHRYCTKCSITSNDINGNIMVIVMVVSYNGNVNVTVAILHNQTRHRYRLNLSVIFTSDCNLDSCLKDYHRQQNLFTVFENWNFDHIKYISF